MNSNKQMEIRPWRKQDAQALAVIANNRNIWNNVRDRLPNPYTVMDALEWIGHISQQKPNQNFAILVNGVIVGNIGAVLYDDIYRKTVEIGYFVGEPHWGKGIASKALALFLDYVEETFNPIRIYAGVFDHNKASMEVLRKNGFYLESVKRKAVIKNGQVLDEQVWVRLVNRTTATTP
jgi:[ribosomal protein S5]-alanine N-acetyltransferase